MYQVASKSSQKCRQPYLGDNLARPCFLNYSLTNYIEMHVTDLELIYIAYLSLTLLGTATCFANFPPDIFVFGEVQ